MVWCVRRGGESVTNLLSITPEEEEPTATVKLLHATRLPARHSRLVRVEVVETQERGEAQLFQAEVEILGKKGLDMADAVVGVGVGGEAGGGAGTRPPAPSNSYQGSHTGGTREGFRSVSSFDPERGSRGDEEQATRCVSHWRDRCHYRGAGGAKEIGG